MSNYGASVVTHCHTGFVPLCLSALTRPKRAVPAAEQAALPSLPTEGRNLNLGLRKDS